MDKSDDASSSEPQGIAGNLAKFGATSLATANPAECDSFRDVLVHLTCPTETTIQYSTNDSSEFQEFLKRMVTEMIESINECPLDETNDPRDEQQPKIGKQFDTICEEFMYQLDNLGWYWIKNTG